MRFNRGRKHWQRSDLVLCRSDKGDGGWSLLAPFVTVTRKSDGAKGTMQFEHMPRVYFNFVPEKE